MNDNSICEETILEDLQTQKIIYRTESGIEGPSQS